ncbi:MAG: acyl-CoA dehydrogenase family protein [Candidatus Heimdallarchaeota archaeon]|nr:acyl-CoA dehydrogenase family protein [Candidatus Heimdallarchaeota archaeon]MDH5644639.1 acyl-CoA dehydrogenase family protein [Candidatus Heimdallarchaeota archaeon]
MNIFSEEHQIIQETVRDFAVEKLDKVAEKMDKEDYFPLELFREIGELGLLGPTIHPDYEGAGADYITQGIILEELSRISPAFALSVGAHSNLCLDNIFRNANEIQRQKYVPDLVTGKKVGCLALTEPNSGSDAMGLKTTAVEEGDFYILSGSKTFITNAPIGDIALIYAKTNPSAGGKGVTAFIMPMNTKGVTTGKPMEKMGMRGSLTGEIFLEDVAIPKENILGQVNNGRSVAMSGLAIERAVLAAISLGISKTALDISLKYSSERHQFGKPINEFQLIKEKIANMYTETQASHFLVYWALSEIETNHNANKESCASIMHASEKSTIHALDAIQILGGYGYMKEYKIEKFARDAKLLEIGAGTTEVRKIIIARELIKEIK